MAQEGAKSGKEQSITASDQLDVRSVREFLGLTRREFGRLLGGYTEGAVAHWEKGRSSPSDEICRRISELVEGKQIPKRETPLSAPTLQVVESGQSGGLLIRIPAKLLLPRVEEATGLSPKMIAAALKLSVERYSKCRSGDLEINDYGRTLLELLVQSVEARTLASKGKAIGKLLPFLRPIPCDKQPFLWSVDILRLRLFARFKPGQLRFGKRLKIRRPEGPVFRQEKVHALERDKLWPTINDLESLAALAKSELKSFPLK